MMKQRLLKTFVLVLAVLGGASFAWADAIAPTLDVYFRTSLSSETYSWSSGYPKTTSESNNEFAGNLRAGMFVLQKYTVPNLAAVKSLTVTMTGSSGTDALAFWTFTNDWTASTAVATLASAVNSAVGLSLNTYGTPSSGTATKLVDGNTASKTTVDGITTCTFTISGDALTALKAAATDNTFTLLITNKTGDMSNDKSGDRKFYSSGHTTEAYRPSVTPTYDAVGVTYGNVTKTNYSSFASAITAVTSAAQDATIVVMEDQNITSRVNAISGKTINIVAGVDGVTLTNTASNTISFLANTDNAGTINVGSADHPLIIKNSATTTNNVVETSGNSSSAIINITNVTFKDISTSSATGLIKANNSSAKISLTDVTFDGCTASASNAGIIYNNSNDLITLSGYLTFTNCTGNNFYLKGRVKESSLNTPSQVYTVYNDGIALGASAVINMNAANRDYYAMVNTNQCLVGKGNNTNEELVVSQAYTLSVGEYGAATLIYHIATTIPDGVSAYTLTYSGGDKVTATPVETTLPANTPVLINAAQGSYKFNATTRHTNETATSGTQTTSGALTGVYETTNVPSESYILWANATNPIGFYKANSNTVTANHCYLTAGSSARSLTIAFDETTGVNTVTTQLNDDKVYDLQGRLVCQPTTKGIYVKNGKKFMVK